MVKYILRLIPFLLFGFIVACDTMISAPGLITAIPSWEYQDLRLLDPADVGVDNEDLVAFYAKKIERELIFRVDFLDLQSKGNNILWIALDVQPGGVENFSPVASIKIPWDYLISIPMAGRPKVLNSNLAIEKDVTLWITRDDRTDSIQIGVIFLSQQIVWSRIKTQIVLGNDQGVVINSLPAVNLDSPPPPKVKLFNIFWNAFPASTPAQALRSWNGAHSGRLSSRHGLSFLLDAVRDTRVPVTLVDFEPGRTEELLDYVGGFGLLDGLGKLGLVEVVGVRGNDYAKFIDNQLFKAPDLADMRDLKKYLFSNSQNQIILLGGDFQKSIFGGSNDTLPLLQFIKHQLWLEPASKPDFVCQVVSCASAGSLPYFGVDAYRRFLLPYGWVMAMRNDPANPFWISARNMYTLYLDPSYENLSQLERLYLALIGHFQAGAEWAERPYSTISCDRDLDLDGIDECILASENSFATIKLNGGYIATFFVRLNDGIHQIIGPSYQLTTELSDPSTWKSNNALNSDPGQILGAFYDKSDTSAYNYVDNNGTLELHNPVTQITKTFSLDSRGLTFEYRGAGSSSFQIPLVIDPWIMSTPGWGYSFYKDQLSMSFLWGIGNRLSAEVIANEYMESSTFIDSRDAIQMPEDPNFNYPPGHFLPFPLAVTDVQCKVNCAVEIMVHQP